jgi:hypothetical protein
VDNKATGLKEYKGGDTSLVTIPRTCTFRNLIVLLEIEPEESDEGGPGSGGTGGIAGGDSATSLGGPAVLDPVLRAAKAGLYKL